jgi:hypothetical protein
MYGDAQTSAPPPRKIQTAQKMRFHSRYQRLQVISL